MTSLKIIAEAAQGYEGSVDLAKLLIRSAKEAEADAVKFQIVFVDELAAPGNIHYDIFKSLEMPLESWQEVKDYAAELGIEFYADVFGDRSFSIAKKINVDGFKLHTTTFFDKDLTQKVLNECKPVLIAFGGITLEELQEYTHYYNLKTRPDVTLMYGFQSEPTPLNLTNLARIPALSHSLDTEIGFLDHVDGASEDAAAITAMSLILGCRIIEKHITLDRLLKIEDYVSALAPKEFKAYVHSIKRSLSAIGSSDIVPTPQELEYRNKAVKKIVLIHDLPAGHTLQTSDITLIRPNIPLGMENPDLVIGKKLTTAVKKSQPLKQSDIE
ncbi:N-acetylneuraminate synthase family protein [Kiloniella laminariae]|uniref:N-acetylneuraminate synthase family protein n=1 Tax=Kiloniella laminariae TaxID=454162 RepID=A0ABT4LMK8_9PROT|nr:N-acetylneuraminate synthase family protein [Kiloniella laminariae]MCZ4282349.1 N-acetylneuraminate synthase family protein [Kiloniella laminariae]